MNFGKILALVTGAIVLVACEAPEEEKSFQFFSAEQMATAEKLRDAALESTATYDILEELVTVAPKRLAGSEGDEIAKDWAVEKLESLDFDRVWVHEFKMRGWERQSASATVLGDEPLELSVTSLGKSVSTPDGGVTAEVIHFPAYSDLEAADASDVEGKIVFISNRMERNINGSGYGPANIARSRGHEMVAEKGGAALLIRSIGTDNHDAPHTGAMSFGKTGMSQPELDAAYDAAINAPYGEQTVASAAISNLDSDVFEAMFQSGEAVSVTLNIKNNDLGEITSYNIIGEITGSERPDEIVVTGGHIDAWDTGVGAMDDGMGVAITMNAASMIGNLERRPARTIRYVAFGAEEVGLLGARAYAREYWNDDHVFGIESDFGIGKVWRLSPSVSADAVPVLGEIATVLEPMGIGWDPTAKGFPGPDLMPLVVAKGMAGASLNGDGTLYFDLHHTAEDTLDKIDAEDLSYNTAAYAALLYLVAEYDGRFNAAKSANEQLDAAVKEMATAHFFHVPEAATQLGVTEEEVAGTGDRMMDRSLAGNAARNQAIEGALAALNAIDADSLSPDRRRTHAVLTTIFEGALAPSRVVDYGTTAGAWTLWYLPYSIVQNSGPTVDIPNFLNAQQPVTNAEEAEAFLVRLASVDEALDGALESYRDGVQKGAIPPDFIVEKSLAVVEAFIEKPAGQNSLYLSYVGKLESAGIEDAEDFGNRALKIIDADVMPAYQRIADYMGEIRGSAPHEAGLWRLPNGEALYAAMIRHMTDSNISADEVHQIGLAEVDRITQEMDAILRAEGLTEGTVGERIEQLNVEERFLYSNDAEGKAQMLADIRVMIDDMYAELPAWFSKVPAHEVDVQMVPEFSQASAPMGYYNPPAPDGSRPGYYFINLRDTALHPSWTLKTLTYHEGVPGHHLDGATSVDLEVPKIVKGLWSNASGEGWALYAEQLAAEMGMYADDPYGDLGRLQAELHRAVRLVTDTGMHAKRWSRERAIEYMVDVEGLDEATATSEIERYVVWPAQALGYKLGQLKILALREEAKEALGENFDIREFNQVVLDVASTPQPLIEYTVRNWIAEFAAE